MSRGNQEEVRRGRGISDGVTPGTGESVVLGKKICPGSDRIEVEQTGRFKDFLASQNDNELPIRSGVIVCSGFEELWAVPERVGSNAKRTTMFDVPNQQGEREAVKMERERRRGNGLEGR